MKQTMKARSRCSRLLEHAAGAYVMLLTLPMVVTQQLYLDAAFDVRNTTNIVYAQGTTCINQLDNTTCKAMALTLDVYEPVQQPGGVPVPARKPAYILMHGGGNSGGSKDQGCFQGSARFFASRGFVAFNINYRLKSDKGLIPASPGAPTPAPGPPPTPAAAGWQLVSHVQRSGFDFFPHPTKANVTHRPWQGLLRLGGANGTLCITAAADNIPTSTGDGLSLTLEACTDDNAPPQSSQVWELTSWDIEKQAVRHSETGYCLDIPGASVGESAEGLPVRAVPCNASSAIQTQWQLGYSGALITQDARMSVSATPPERPSSMSNPSLRSSARRPQNPSSSMPASLAWNPNWQSGYPAVRDLKAAVRFVRARATAYGVDAARVVVSGGSAGATNSLAAGATFESDYVDELGVEQDPTLTSTHLDQNSSVQCVVSHWASDGEIMLAQAHDTQNRTRFGPNNAPIIEFHGNQDSTIPVSQARAVQTAYAHTGVPYELHILEGCGHAAWCYNGKGACSCTDGVAGYDATMDTIALSFVAKQLELKLLGHKG